MATARGIQGGDDANEEGRDRSVGEKTLRKIEGERLRELFLMTAVSIVV